ncbi:MAG: tetratricopeptide repeat protein, partial [Limisphaerales bacterium]
MSMLLPAPDSHHFSAAIGWIELGNPGEALQELNRISAEHREHPAVLEAEWVICAEQKDWKRGLEVSQLITRKAPNSPAGWLHQAYALRRVENGSLEAAWDALLPAYEKFPNEPT